MSCLWAKFVKGHNWRRSTQNVSMSALPCYRQLKFELPRSLSTIWLCVLMSSQMRGKTDVLVAQQNSKTSRVSELVHATRGVTASRFAGRSANRTTPTTRDTITSVKFR